MEKTEDVLEEIKQKGKNPNRFSKKNFKKLMKAMVNDPEFVSRVAKVSGNELKEIKDVMVSKSFRSFLRGVLETAGIDKNESKMVFDESFQIENVDGLYDFIEAVIYEYVAAGNRFEFKQRDGFRGSFAIKEVGEKTRVREVSNPHTKEKMGTYEFYTAPHKVLVSSSPCPTYLKKRKKKY